MSCDLLGRCFPDSQSRRLCNPCGRSSSSGRCQSTHSGRIYCSRHCPTKRTWYFKPYAYIWHQITQGVSPSCTKTYGGIIRWHNSKFTESLPLQSLLWGNGLERGKCMDANTYQRAEVDGITIKAWPSEARHASASSLEETRGRNKRHLFLVWLFLWYFFFPLKSSVFIYLSVCLPS